MRKWTIYIIITALVLGGGDWLIMKRQSAQSAASDQAAETAVVQRGDLAVSIDATGSLVSPTESSLAFPMAGKIHEIFIGEGQIVTKGDLLARLEDNIQAEADFLALFSDVGVARAELALAHAEDALTYTVDDLAYLIGVEAFHWEGQLKQTEERLAALNEDPSATAEQKIEAQKAVDEARGWRDYYRELNIKKLEKEYEDFEVLKTIRMRGHTRHVFLYTISYKVDTELLLAYANWEDAKVALQDAQAALETVKAGHHPPCNHRWPPLGPEMARLESTRRDVENTLLTAPADGMVTKLNFQAGEYVKPGVSVIVVSNLTVLEAEVNLDENDVSRVQAGTTVLISVDAFPGQQLTGQLTEIALSANIQSGVVLYPVTIHLDPTDLPLRSGMTINVTFPIEQRSETLLVPIRAVETEDGQAYVTRVTASGSERVAVTLGLITDTQVEILSGINEGDVVTVFANPVQETELMSRPRLARDNDVNVVKSNLNKAASLSTP